MLKINGLHVILLWLAMTLALQASTNDVRTLVWSQLSAQQKQYDWVELKNNERLSGYFTYYYNDIVTFKSKKLGLLKLKIRDIRQFVSSRPASFNIENLAVLYGKFIFQNEKMTIYTHEGNITIGYDQIVSIYHGEAKESNYWNIKIGFNTNIRGGNSKQFDYGASVDMTRRTAKSRFLLNYIGNIANVSDARTSESHSATSSFDYFKTRHFFLRPLSFSFYRDPFQNISSRLSYGVGAGYDIIRNAITTWSITGGPGYQYTRFTTSLEDESDYDETFSLILDTLYTTRLIHNIGFTFGYKLSFLDQESGSYTHHMITKFVNAINKNFDIGVSLVWDRIESPSADSDGVVPNKDDYRMMLSIGYKYN